MNFSKIDRTFIIAEIGVNHEGDEAVAADLIREAAAAGADAVKFQTFEIHNYISTVQRERFERTQRFQLTREAFARLADLAKQLGVIFFSTPFHMHDADFLDTIAPIFKVSSGDLTFLPLIRQVASKKKPMIISTGLGTEAEIAAAVAEVEAAWPTVREDGGLALLHCVASYPTNAENANLRNIAWMKERFQLPIGYSDHTLGTKACELAVGVGAVILEKHFTYRKEDQTFHDHLLSADPDDMAELVRKVREAEVYLGSRDRIRTEAPETLAHMRRSLGAAVDIPAGEPVKAEWITWLRPAWGIGPENFDAVVGRPLNRAVKAGDLLKSEDLT